MTKTTNDRGGGLLPILLLVGALLFLLSQCSGTGGLSTSTGQVGGYDDGAELAAPGPTVHDVPAHSHGPCEMVAELDAGTATAGPEVAADLRARCDAEQATTTTAPPPPSTEPPTTEPPATAPSSTTTVDPRAVV